MDDHTLIVVTVVATFVTVALALIGVGVAALAVPSHPDRAKAAKICFSLAALLLAVTTIFWTISKGYGLGWRIGIDLAIACLVAIGILAGFRFADRSLLAELSLPASAFIPESLFRRRGKLIGVGLPVVIFVIILVNVSLSPQQEAKTTPTPTPTPTPTSSPAIATPTPKPIATSTTSPLPPAASPAIGSSDGFDGAILIKGGAPITLESLLRAKGYNGSPILVVFEFNILENSPERIYWSSPQWTGLANARYVESEGYNAPGVTDARNFWLFTPKDSTIGARVRAR